MSASGAQPPCPQDEDGEDPEVLATAKEDAEPWKSGLSGGWGGVYL